MSSQYIYIARHGETDSNLNGISQGIESELNETGHAQARLLATRTTNLNFSRLIVSPFKRAQQTAAYIAAEKGIEVETLAELREVANPPSMVGESRDGEVYQAYLKARMDSFRSGEGDFVYAGEESFNAVIRRVESVFNHLESFSENAFVVSHGHFLRHLVAYVLNGKQLTPAVWATIGFRMDTTNTGITVLRRELLDGVWRLHSFNDVAHFADN